MMNTPDRAWYMPDGDRDQVGTVIATEEKDSGTHRPSLCGHSENKCISTARSNIWATIHFCAQADNCQRSLRI